MTQIAGKLCRIFTTGLAFAALSVVADPPRAEAAAEPSAARAANDRFAITPGAVLKDNVLTNNGSGPDAPGSTPTRVMLDSNVRDGKLSLKRNGVFTYTPSKGFVGTDRFVYHLRDSGGNASNEATVTIDVLAAASAPPNVLMFVADDIGWGDLPSYNPNALIPMPALEDLANRGMRFTDAHTSASKCAPSRYSIVTGNYHWRGRFPWGQWDYRGGSQFLPDQLTVADLLNRAGYNTAVVGKWHLGGDVYVKNSQNFANPKTIESTIDFGRPYQNGPLAHGFDYSFTLLRGMQGSPYAYFEDDEITGQPSTLKHWAAGTYGASIIQYPGIGMPYYDSSKVGPDLVQAAIGFLTSHQARNDATGNRQPFFLYYAAQSRHAPYTPPVSLLGEPVKGVTRFSRFGDMIYEVDVALGKLIEKLDQLDLTRETLIVFTSDNGGLDAIAHKGHDSNPGLRGNKGDSYEGGHRVPLIVRLDSVVAPGTSSKALVGTQDITATVAALTGVQPGTNQARDSISLVPLLKRTKTSVRTELIHEASDHDNKPVPRHFALRSGDWKLIFDDKRQPSELFNLANDLGEQNDQIDEPQQANRVAQMKARFDNLMNAQRTAP